ncbi:MAG: hypothetical protein ACKPKO_31255 [Candidatus Fonsibacter sp.]
MTGCFEYAIFMSNHRYYDRRQEAAVQIHRERPYRRDDRGGHDKGRRKPIYKDFNPVNNN